jgi:hypothetical protein
MASATLGDPSSSDSPSLTTTGAFPYAVAAGCATVLSAVAADLAAGWAQSSLPRLPSALVDNAGHGLVALVSWAGAIALQHRSATGSVFAGELAGCMRVPFLPSFPSCGLSLLLTSPCSSLNPTASSLAAAVLCGIVACALDIDHFLAAGSLSMDGAMGLHRRPFGHSVTFVAASVFAALFLPALVPSTARCAAVHHLWLLLLVAWGTHQLRDATRRGLWFWPAGSTPPVPYWLYLAALALVPLVTQRAMGFGHSNAGKAAGAPGAMLGMGAGLGLGGLGLGGGGEGDGAALGMGGGTNDVDL